MVHPITYFDWQGTRGSLRFILWLRLAIVAALVSAGALLYAVATASSFGPILLAGASAVISIFAGLRARDAVAQLTGAEVERQLL